MRTGRMVRCDTCGAETPELAHQFFEGGTASEATKTAVWIVRGALYHLDSSIGPYPAQRDAAANFCGARCACAGRVEAAA